MSTIQLAPLQWSEPARPGPDCGYDHIKASTPFGEFLLTWKGWKDYPMDGLGFDETPWGEIEYRNWGSIDEAKEWAQQELTRRIQSMLKES